MDYSEAINSTSDDDRILHLNTYIEKDKSQGIKNVAQLSTYEEKIANNGLKFSILLHILVILSTLAIIILNTKLVSEFNNENNNSTKINFGLINMNIRSNNETNNYYYYCFQPNEKYYESSNNTICTIRADCTKENKENTFDTSKIDLTCDSFKQFMIMGLIVKNYFKYLLF
jgi:hypothetical protein